jgi:hypothetical protein
MAAFSPPGSFMNTKRESRMAGRIAAVPLPLPDGPKVMACVSS